MSTAMTLHAANPYNTTVGWAAIDSANPGGQPAMGQMGPAYRPFSSVLWKAADNPWNGRNTTAGNRIENCDLPMGFPFTLLVAKPGGGVIQIEITAAESDAFWDAHYVGKTRVSGSTFATNCFAFATGKSYWVEGFATLLADEYNSVNTGCNGGEGFIRVLKNGDVISLPGHAQKITSVCKNSPFSCDNIGAIQEKNGSSGVYETVYSCPGGLDGTYLPIYRHK